VLPPALRAQLATWAVARYPREACGLLIGSRENGLTRVRLVLEARNLVSVRAHERFELDPADHVAADEISSSLGLEIVGVWHAHPDRAALPSEADRAAAWSAWSHVIVSVVAGEARALSAWRLVSGRFEREHLLP
jgi:proteasome lid subunit RPN8/RPN11